MKTRVATMSQEQRPLYGELVIPFGNSSGVQNNRPTHYESNKISEQIRLMIEEAAYFRAEKRGFGPGHELDDWFHAEAQILRSFAKTLADTTLRHKGDE